MQEQGKQADNEMSSRKMPDVSSPESGKILGGLRVLDIGTMIAAPVSATLMADLGADVIKVEQPGTGDTLRGLGPFLEGESLWWTVDGRNKRSITLNLRDKRGQDILRKLIQGVDVLVENFRPGTLKKWGLDYESLLQINPGLVMLSVSGFGQTGPYADRAGYDRMGLAFSGVMGITGYPDRPPVRIGISACDYMTATLGAFAVMSALYNRRTNGGSGQQIDLALYESMFRMTESMTAAYDRLGIVRQRTGNVHYAAAPGDNFETSDGHYIVLTCSGNVIFRKVCLAMNRPDLVDRPEYASHAKRWEEIGELNAIVRDWVRSTPIADVKRSLDDHGVPYSVVFTIEDIVKNEHFASRKNIISVDHPTLGPIKMQGVVPHFSSVKEHRVRPAPSVGQHNREVYLDEFGMSESEFSSLQSEGVI